MNATWKSAVTRVGILAIAFSVIPQFGLAQETTQRLDRNAVEAILLEARAAIESGDLAKADKLISRCEAADVRYPLINMGDTPAKARRDLQRARSAYPATDPFLKAKAPALKVDTADAGSTVMIRDDIRELPKPAGQLVAVGDRYSLAAPATEQKPDKLTTARNLVGQSRQALEAGDLKRAEALAAKASKLNVPEKAFAQGEETPTQLAWALQKRRSQMDSAVMPAGGVLPEAAPPVQALHVPENDATQIQQVTSTLDPSLATPPTGPRLAQVPTLAKPPAQARPAARAQASAESIAPPPAEIEAGSPLIDQADADQQLLARQLSTAVGQTQVDSRAIRESEPRRSLEMLETVKTEVQNSALAQQYRDQLVRRVDRSITETKKYIEDNRAQIELDEQNAAILAEIDRENAAKQKVRDSIAEHVDEFNQLLDQQRYEEAEVIAKRLYEIAPNDPVALQVWNNAKFIRREMMNRDLLDRKDSNNWRMFNDVEESAVPDVFDGTELAYGENWKAIKEREGFSNRRGRRTERELEIERRLKTPVQLRYNNRPLSEVLESLSQMTGVNIHIDPRGLNQEGVSSDTPVSINLSNEIMLKSALNLILEPLHLGYTIKDEVLKVTSETLRDGEVYTETYYVADLVIPIPNFVPSNNIGLQGLINDALAVTGYGAGGLGAPGPIALANNRQAPGGPGSENPDVLAQSFGAGPQAGPQVSPLTTGPGGLGGAAQADFDSLIDLIVSTVQSDTWAENGGGEAEIRSFPTNLSLVVSQTQAAHEEIADLLEQLRKLQDLQVTIEVRFIQLSDDFFERIGIDFDMNINDGTNGAEAFAGIAGAPFENTSGGFTVGAQAPIAGDLAQITADLDVPFRQGSFPVALPTFGGFNPSTAASFGFAILSDIEAYFLINAAQGDSRTNMLNAPKVTLFNGQQAFVSDTSQSPFVISVIPVVGEFAAAQQPVIVVLSEGTLMSIQAVVSDDRRYVRLTVVPFFSEIGDVQTFTFDGTTTTNNNSSSSATDADDDGNNESQNNANDTGTVIAGTTVQLPTFQFVSVTTTVSVPDGGTVLLGGIKRLSEGREEFGVPLLSKVPYINRLFRNVGIGRETDSLMMMVTPRIIIQEEEEQNLGLAGQ